MFVLIVLLLAYNLPLISMESAALKPLKSLEEVVAYAYGADRPDKNVIVEENILTEALAPLIFGKKVDTHINERFKEKLSHIKSENNSLYDDITFYTFYRVAKDASPQNDIESIYFSPRSMDMYRLKEKYGLSLSTARLQIKEISHDVYKEELHKKELHKRIVLYAGIATTIVTSTASILITYFSVKNDCP